jgi:hypothetical protein
LWVELKSSKIMYLGEKARLERTCIFSELL